MDVGKVKRVGSLAVQLLAGRKEQLDRTVRAALFPDLSERLINRSHTGKVIRAEYGCAVTCYPVVIMENGLFFAGRCDGVHMCRQ